MSRCGGLPAFLAGTSILVAALSANAADRVPFTWSAPPECPTAEDVVRAAARLVGDDPPWPAGSPTVQAVVEYDGGEYLLTLTSVDRAGSESRVRRASAVACHELAELAALGIALLVEPAPDPPRHARESAPTPEPAAAPDDESGSVGSAPPPEPVEWRDTVTPDPLKDDVEPHATPSVALAFGPFGALTVGALPSPAPGAGFRAGALFAEHLRLEGFGAYFFEQTHASAGGARGAFSLITGGARACYLTPALGPLGLCSGVEIGAIRSAGVDIASSNHSSGRWLAPHVGPAAILPAGPVQIVLAADALFPLWSESFVVRLDEREEVVHQIEPWALRLASGVELVIE